MKTVTLSQSYDGHAAASNVVSFREPTFADVMALGEPWATGVMPGGVYLRDINYECVLGYTEKLVQNPWNSALLGQLNVKDTRLVVAAILDFFREPETSPEKPTTSSSPSDGTPEPSAP